MPKSKPVRRPNQRFGGTQVTICGVKLRTPHNLICTFPYKHYPKSIHGTIATADDNSVVAVVDDILKSEVDMWQLVDPHE